MLIISNSGSITLRTPPSSSLGYFLIVFLMHRYFGRNWPFEHVFLDLVACQVRCSRSDFVYRAWSAKIMLLGPWGWNLLYVRKLVARKKKKFFLNRRQWPQTKQIMGRIKFQGPNFVAAPIGMRYRIYFLSLLPSYSWSSVLNEVVLRQHYFEGFFKMRANFFALLFRCCVVPLLRLIFGNLLICFLVWCLFWMQ